MGISSALTALVTTCPWIFDLTSEMCFDCLPIMSSMSPKHLDSTCVQLNSLLSPHDLLLGQDSQETAPVGSKLASKKPGHRWVSVFLSTPLSNPPQVPCVCPPKQVVPDLSPSPLP